jgi:ABC-type antimicrobial peptide transport system permease subunit
VTEILRSLDPELPFVEVHTLRQEVETSLWQERLLAALSSLFAAIALVLASIGLYGALDYAVRTRTREIGIRAALGAEPARIARLLWRETMVLVSAGATLGLAAHAALGGRIHALLYGVEPSDPAALGTALVFATAAAVLASLPPVWRAIRTDPAAALRLE